MSAQSETQGWQYYKLKYGDIDWSFKKQLPWQVSLTGWSCGQGYDYQYDEGFGRILMKCVNDGHPLDAARYIEVFHFPDGYVFDHSSKTERNPNHKLGEDGKVFDERGKEIGWWAQTADEFVKRAAAINAFV